MVGGSIGTNITGALDLVEDRKASSVEQGPELWSRVLWSATGVIGQELAINSQISFSVVSG